MPSRHLLILALSIPASLALVAALVLALARPAPQTTLVTAPYQFDGGRAQKDALSLSAIAPKRPVGSSGSARAREWLSGQFEALGLQTGSLPFTVTVASQARTGTQLWATLPGVSDSILLITANYDTPDQAGRDNVMGVATLLELARALAPGRPRHTFIFLATDSREYGQAWGTQALLDQASLRGKVVAALSLEALAGQDWARVRIQDAGFQFGFAPLWLRGLARTAVVDAGGQAEEGGGAEEYLARALPFDMTDHGMLLRAGIPAAGLSGSSPGPDAASVSTPEILGRAAEAWLRKVDTLDELPPGSPFDWQLTSSTYIPGWATLAATLLVFAPLFLATALALASQRPRSQDLGPELMALAGAATPFINGYAVAFILVRLGLLPGYEWFPASPGDPFLLQPTDWAMLVILATMGLSTWDIFGRARSWGRLADRLAVPFRRVTLLLTFTLLIVTLWVLNGFAAALLLAPAAYLWPWIEPRRLSTGRALNVMLAVGGLLPLVGVCVTLALTPGLGLWWWFLTVGAAYGLYPLPIVVMFAAFAALFVRFVRLGTRET